MTTRILFGTENKDNLFFKQSMCHNIPSHSHFNVRKSIQRFSNFFFEFFLVAVSDEQRHSIFRLKNNVEIFSYRDATRINVKSEFAEQIDQDHFVFVCGKFQTCLVEEHDALSTRHEL